jgi:serine/threonine protein kinase
MAAVSHPGLLVIHEATAWQGVPVLIVEYLPGGTLADRLRSGPLPTAEVVDIGIALAGALSHLHARGLLHGDIKPSNIGFAEERTPKLLDFGLSRLLSRTRATHPDSTTRSGINRRPSNQTSRETLGDEHRSYVGAGTPAYMSPEAILQERDAPAFDLWSLAVVLFEALAGEHPFRRDTVAETFATIHASAGVDIRRYAPDVPDLLVDVFRDALSPHRQNRPRSSAAFRHRLEVVRDDVRSREILRAAN